MRRTTLRALIAASLAAGLVPPAATSAARTDDTAVTDAAVRHLEPIELECGVRDGDAQVAVRCEWSQPASPSAHTVRLYRFDPATDPHRTVVFRTVDLGDTTFTDTQVRPKHRYGYVVVVGDRHGRTVGRSRAAWVSVPGDAPMLEPIDLACNARSIDARVAVRCEWSQPTSDAAAVVELHRYAPEGDPQRTVVFRTSDLAETGYTDLEVRPGHRYFYAVVVTDDAGRAVGRSRAVGVSVPGDRPDVEVIELDCALESSREWIGCRWSRPRSRDAAVVSLWRSVDDGPRELVETFRPHGPNAHRDRVPVGGREVTYAVIVTAETDRVIGRSRPVTVRIPRIDDRPTDVRRVDVPTTTTEPPTDVRPADVPTTTTEPPTDVRPADAPTTTLSSSTTIASISPVVTDRQPTATVVDVTRDRREGARTP